MLDRPSLRPTRLFRSRAAIEAAVINGIRAIIELHDFDPANRTEIAIAEINLRSHLAFEVLLDIRDLLAECAWRLSDIAPPEAKPSESDPLEGDS